VYREQPEVVIQARTWSLTSDPGGHAALQNRLGSVSVLGSQKVLGPIFSRALPLTAARPLPEPSPRACSVPLDGWKSYTS